MNKLLLILPLTALLVTSWASWKSLQMMQAHSWQEAIVLISIHYPLCLWSAGFSLIQFGAPLRLFALAFAALNALLIGGAIHG